MSKLLVEDALWERVEPLLPTPKPRRFRYPGRKPLDNRAALTGILFILKTGLPWNDLPREMGCGPGAACWVRLHEWHELGVWAALHALLLAELRYADKIDWSRAAVDATTIRALRGGDKTGKTPTDRGRKGTKDRLLTDGGGIPLTAHATGANRHDVTQLKTLVEAVPPVAGKPGHPKRKPEAVLADRAYDSLDEVAQACAVLAEATATARLCVTMGADGAMLWSQGKVVHAPAPAVVVKDTVGAGDAFIAGLILGLTRGADPQVVLNLACRVGAYVASCDGATPLLPPELIQEFAAAFPVKAAA